MGDSVGRRGQAQVTLIDRSRTHLWKPLLHEVAAGSMDIDQHTLDYLAQARWHHFRFRLGSMAGLDRERRVVRVAPTHDEEGRLLIGEREIRYDTLVLAVGSGTNDFGTPGAQEHAISLDTPLQAERFHNRLINACIRANAQREPLRPEQLHVAIIPAELHHTTRELVAFGLERIDAERDIRITLIEAGPRVLPALPERLSTSTTELLEKLRVQVLTGARVTAVEHDGVILADGRKIPAELTVWAAGIKAPDFLKDIAGLETNRLNQLVVTPQLQTTRDPDIFALGDCAACPWPGRDHNVPPRAQAAHQQATLLTSTLRRRLADKPPRPFVYRDFGSLVSLGDYSTVGSLMGALIGGSLFIEGLFARMMYISLYRMHLYALHGFAKVFFDTLARLITRRTEPRVKLHLNTV
ncbi:MAG: NAD(P)/FAD-dependent oxidoreductase [Burkholderiales bacterium]